jgi:SAM-dependent methyltransferase
MDYQRLYEYRFRNIDQRARVAVWREIAVYLYQQLGRPQRVLDPAAGRGEFITTVPTKERWGIDRAKHANGGYGPGVRTLVGDVFEMELPNSYFDGVVVSNFLEHLATQELVAAFLMQMHAATAPGGRIAIMGPNFRYCSSEYFDMADHVLAFTHRAVAEHVYAAGFEPERVVARFLPFSFTGRLPPSPILARGYLRMSPAWRIFGKQFLVIARRD